MSESTHVNDLRWPADQALTMACAIYRTKGFTSTSTYISSDAENELRWTSKEHLCYQLVPSIASKGYNTLVNVIKADVDMAQDIIKHYRRLSFGVIADSISDYMQRVFATTQNNEVSFKDFGVLASVPSVFSKEMERRRIEQESKNAVQEHIGTIGNWIELKVRYINSRHVQKLNCYAHDAITESGHLVNFLNKSQLGKPGDTQTIRAKVKEHGTNYQTKAVETKLNYVKPIDITLEWQ